MVDLVLERNVISSMITCPEFFSIGLGELKREDFKEFPDAFDALFDLWKRGEKVSLVTFWQSYRPTELLSIPIVTQSALYITFEWDFKKAVSNLKKLTQCRKIATQSEQMMKLAINGKLEESIKLGVDTFFSAELLSEESKIFTPREHAKQILELVCEDGEARKQQGVFTPFQKLNEMINGGFSEGDLIIIAAPTGHGKTALSMNFMECFAMIQKAPSLYINTEMSQRQLNARWISILSKDSKITYGKVESGKLTDEEKSIVIRAMDSMDKSQFYSITVPELDIQKTESIIRRYKALFGLKVAVVDYVGRMDTQDPKKPKHEVLELIAKRLKTLAQREKIVIIMVAQLTKGGTLQGSQAMENEATLYAVLERPKGETKESKEKLKWLQDRGGNARLLISKNRIGPEGYLVLKFQGDQLIFKEVAT